MNKILDLNLANDYFNHNSKLLKPIRIIKLFNSKYLITKQCKYSINKKYKKFINIYIFYFKLYLILEFK